MTKNDEERPSTEIPGDSDDIEILEIEGMTGPIAPPADEEVEVEFDVPSAASGPAATPATEPREDPASQERLIRLQADFENLKKRIEREEAEFRKVATSRLVTSLLPVLDNLERAIATERPEGDDVALRTGVQLIHRQLIEVLRREGLRPVDALGQPFDPAIHEALATEPAPGLPPNTVVEEIQRGYFLHERLLRPALVRVSVREGPVADDSGPREGR